MARYDTNSNGVLELEEFTALVCDLHASRKLKLRQELQQEIDRLAIEDNPWSMALSGDSKLQHLVRDMRGGKAARIAADPGKAVAAHVPSYASRVAHHRFAPMLMRDSVGRRLEGCRGMVGRCCRLMGRVPVMHPESQFRTLWGLTMALLICYCGVVVPLEIGFDRAMRAAMGSDGWATWEVSRPPVATVDSKLGCPDRSPFRSPFRDRKSVV